MSKKMCIYQILNIENGKTYIGGTTNYIHRKRQHKSDLKLNKHGNPRLQEDYNKFGKSCFQFSIIEVVTDEYLLKPMEQKWLEYSNPEYNITDNINPFSPLFFESHQSEEYKQKRSKALREYYKTDAGIKRKKRAGERWKGENNPIHSRSKEERFKTSQLGIKARTAKGYKHSKTTKERMSASAKKTYVGAVSPDGKVYAPIHGMQDFCLKHNLCLSSMVGLMHKRISQHKGWTRYEPT